ncbi:MAG: type II toxin-antitoxin system RelE/ParE family toxin [Flavobacterium sp. JAD_PAG50586_2]|nr:MAG: type II toxin-antitoxin system RelE/ParE family toxin [Flavobacterium sp. JAD_PAG50586_2]
MAQLTINWTETAIRQRNYILEYWIERNQSTTYAKKLNEKIKERTNLLKQNPDLGKKTDFNSTRVLSLGHYNILYQKSDTKIIITGFWDNRQEPEKLLKFLKK